MLYGLVISVVYVEVALWTRTLVRDSTLSNDISENIVVHRKNGKRGFDSVSEVVLN